MINCQLCVAIFNRNARSTCFRRHHVTLGCDLDPFPFGFRCCELVGAQFDLRVRLGPVSGPLLPAFGNNFRLGPSFISIDKLLKLFTLGGIC
jgi:hypothetical protein